MTLPLPRIQIDPAYTADPCAITVTRPTEAPTWAGATITVKAQLSNETGSVVTGTVSAITADSFVMTFAAGRTDGTWDIQARLVLASGQVETLEFVQTVRRSLT